MVFKILDMFLRLSDIFLPSILVIFQSFYDTQVASFVVFRFLFFNRHVGVLYSCLSITVDGKCDERAIYVISRHETIDHAELIVLEKVAKAVCVDPHVLYHTATFEIRT
ncbi:hypothetical protein DICVIV_09248 [Dictyocaulus viviparus]|uniref:Uncharacterized protein n=1 Tax=Dictyocaulus viviparus TaxID=29172 RepID=A0A0D8XLR7_DICVI|nr:hypothetical protein DICVIV_09248 [Dictyocaulus viviparus]